MAVSHFESQAKRILAALTSTLPPHPLASEIPMEPPPCQGGPAEILRRRLGRQVPPLWRWLSSLKMRRFKVTPKVMLLMANVCQLRSTVPEVMAKIGSRIHSKTSGRFNAFLQNVHDSSGSGEGGWGGLSFSPLPLAFSLFFSNQTSLGVFLLIHQ